MKFGEFYSETFGWTMEQINKTIARKLYAEGKTIYLISCNMRFDNVWQLPFPMHISDGADSSDSFDDRVNKYIYYNCDNERGKYPCFFVRKEN